VVPGQTGYAFQNIDPQMVLNLGLDQIDPETAAFFGYTPGSTNVPNELLQSYIQGSIVSGGEDVETQHHYDTGTPWASGDPLTHAGEYVGTWHDLVAGEHPLFPGGLDEYYEYMDDPFTIPINYGEPGGGYEDYWGDWGDYGGRRPSLAEYARQHWFSESLSDVEAKEAKREAEGLGAATMSDMERMYAKDFSAEIGPDPFFDPDFSYEMYEDYDPIFAGMDLFQRARG
jgi:hypothetical protein